MATQLSKETMIKLFTTMVRARAFDEKAMELFTQGSIPGFIHVGIGQEAIAAGVCLNLNPEDSIFITHRGHAQSVAKGIDLNRAMAELFGKEAGLCRGKAGSIHLADKNVGILGASGIVGAGIPVATGAALSYKIQGSKQVVACFFGEGSVNQGTFHESLNMASLWDLPIVYCCENNGWAQFTPQTLTTRVLRVATRAAAYDIPGITIDGDDVVAVYEAAANAIERARRGDGSTLLEFLTHRWYGHYVGDPQKYRQSEDIEESRKFDPIAKFESDLIQKKVLTPDRAKDIKDKAYAEVDEAIKFAEQAPLPEPQEALQDIYHEGA